MPYVEKFDIEKGDTLTFKQKYKSKKYKFKLTKTYEHPSFFAVFMDIRDFRKTFKEDKDYYNGYFSNRKLKDLKSKDIALTVTGKDLSALTEQMNEAMKGINTTFVFATLVIYIQRPEGRQRGDPQARPGVRGAKIGRAHV